MDIRLLILLVIMTSSTNGLVSTSRGVYFQKIENMKVYEHTTPIIYYFNIPKAIEIDEIKNHMWHMGACDKNHVECKEVSDNMNDYLRWLSELQSLKDDIVKEFLPIPNKRPKRGIQWLGSFQHWCCNVLTEEQGQEFRNKENTLREGYTKLREGLIEDHAALLNISTETQMFNEKIVQNVDELKNIIKDIYLNYASNAGEEEKRNKAFKAIQKYLNNAFVQVQKLQYLFSSCKNHYLPLSIVKKGTLIKDLKKIIKLSENNNFELV